MLDLHIFTLFIVLPSMEPFSLFFYIFTELSCDSTYTALLNLSYTPLYNILNLYYNLTSTTTFISQHSLFCTNTNVGCTSVSTTHFGSLLDKHSQFYRSRFSGNYDLGNRCYCRFHTIQFPSLVKKSVQPLLYLQPQHYK